MELGDYLLNLENRYQRYFDIEKNVKIFNQEIEMFARYRSINISTFITKKDIVDSYENNEFCFLKGYDRISADEINSFTEFLKTASANYVKPSRNHMSSYITGIMLVDEEIEREAENMVKAFKHSKVFMCYLRGWCDIRLILVNLKNGQVITNKAAAKVKKVYEITPFNK